MISSDHGQRDCDCKWRIGNSESPLISGDRGGFVITSRGFSATIMQYCRCSGQELIIGKGDFLWLQAEDLGEEA